MKIFREVKQLSKSGFGRIRRIIEGSSVVQTRVVRSKNIFTFRRSTENYFGIFMRFRNR